MKYFFNIIKKAKHGFMRLNSCFSGLSIEEFKILFNVFKDVCIENCEESNADGNTLLITW
jgi:hypothetical protein